LNIANVYKEMNYHDSAYIYTAKLLNGFDNLSAYYKSSAYSIRADIFLFKNMNDSAVYYSRKILKVDTNNIDANITLGNYYNKINNFQLAKKYYLLVLKKAKNKSDIVNYMNTLKSIGFLYQENNQYKKANSYLTTFKKLNDSIHKTNIDKRLNDLQGQLKKDAKNTKIQLQQKQIKKQIKNNRINKLFVYATFLLLVFFLLFLHLSYERYKVKHKITLIDQTQKERSIISQNLHEDFGINITYIISAIDNIIFDIKKDTTFILEKVLDIRNFTTNMISLYRTTLWALSSDTFTIKEIFERNYLFLVKINEDHSQAEINIEQEHNTNPKIHSNEALCILRISHRVILIFLKKTKSKIIDFSIIQNNNIISINIVGDHIDNDTLSNASDYKYIFNILQETNGEINNSSNELKTKISITYTITPIDK